MNNEISNYCATCANYMCVVYRDYELTEPEICGNRYPEIMDCDDYAASPNDISSE